MIVWPTVEQLHEAAEAIHEETPERRRLAEIAIEFAQDSDFWKAPAKTQGLDPFAVGYGVILAFEAISAATAAHEAATAVPEADHG